MRGIFSYDGPLMSGLIKIVDCIFLSVLWLVFSLPVVTIGASSAALYATVYKYIRRNEGTLWQVFWGAFRENLRRSTLLWLIALAIQALLVLDASVFRGMALRGELPGRLYWLLLVLCCVSVVWVVYLTAYSARFEGTVKDVLKFSVSLMLMHPLSSLGILAVMLASAALVIIAPGFLAVLPSVSCLVCSVVTEKVFLRHMREEDVKRTLVKEDAS